MADPDEVARALSRLATGTALVREHHALNPERVVADAEAAMERIHRAAAFLDAGGEPRLQRAIQAADANGDAALAARGRTVLTTLAAFRAASTGSERANCSASARQTTSTALAQRSSGEGS